MCGIAGFAGRPRGASEALLETMTETLRHRGPDDSGFYCRAGVGLGSRRLAVIDLESGKQPISGERGHVVVFNGEIYNFKPLRSELERRGHRFKTHADTEVIVHLYEEKGVECFKDLSGMFAIALWDPEKEQLVLARDPLGVKPLYYALAAGGLYFGSELKALRKVPEISLDIDLTSLDSYLDHLHISAPRSIYREVFKLRPGQWLIWRDGSLRTGTFWEPRVHPVRMDWKDAVAGLDGLLGRILEDQRAADVPIGLFLSGGLDSSALAYYLAGARVPPEAFCVYFSGEAEAFNEVHKARAVARRLGLTLNELQVEPGIEETLDPLLHALDEPLADSSALPTYWISRAARGSVKVALTGIGGDEVFG
ncbi:MAG: asparagine synthase (glutamine-hydrolyzing), partial [Elusimicrobia bacterium]|nr:asparagine synthase (glutamine-hydrolyzing) [Elusimicrobiota bacterium]